MQQGLGKNVLKEEKRRTPRIAAGLIIQVVLLPGKNSLLGHMGNLSAGGVLIKSHGQAAPSTKVKIRFNLPPVPPGLPVEVDGVVVHSRKDAGMGIQFLDMKDAQSKAIAKFVQEARN